MELEFDAAKSQANRAKHGIDFIEAQQLWGKPRTDSKFEREQRTNPGMCSLRLSSKSSGRPFHLETHSADFCPKGQKVSSIMKAKNLQKMFDEGKDVMPHLDLSKVRRPGHEQRRVNVDFPSWIIDSLDAQVSQLGVTRQIAERLKEEQKKAS